MQIETKKLTVNVQPAEDVNTQTVLCGATFVNSVPWEGVVLAVSIGRNVDRIRPARLKGDGTAVPIDDNQRSDGLLLSRLVSDTRLSRRVLRQHFVPWANVAGVGYAEEAPTK